MATTQNTFLTADSLIEKRRRQWQYLKSVGEDASLRRAIALEIVRNPSLVQELRLHPEKLVELMFVIPDKQQNTVPFFLNEVQKEFICALRKVVEEYNSRKRSSISIIVLKGRQQGFTSLITAYQLASILLSRNFEGMTVADDSRNAETIFENKAKFMLKNLPEILHPREKYNNRRELRFAGLNSGWTVETAGRQMGRSRTVNFLHASECAFWRCGIAPVQAALGEALTPDCIKIYESTANGYNDYYEFWNNESHVTLFYPWWKSKEYRQKFENPAAKRKFTLSLQAGDGWLYSRLRWLKEKGLDSEQLNWYAQKYNGYLDKSLLRQEYPCTPEDAFVFSGRSVFDNEAVLRHKENAEAYLSGEFIFARQENMEAPSNPKFVESDGGSIHIFKQPIEGVPYVIGGDIAGEGSECFCAQVLDNRNGEQVAVYHAKYDEAAYAEQIFCLGRFYNDALIATEVNSGIYASELLRRWNYPRLYRRERVDTYTNRLEAKYGFRTTSLTRPLIISGFVQFCKDYLYLIKDEGTLSEMLTFIKDEHGRESHRKGATDDRIIAYAIALFAGKQQSKSATAIPKFSVYTSDMLEDYHNSDETVRRIMREKFGIPQ